MAKGTEAVPTLEAELEQARRERDEAVSSLQQRERDFALGQESLSLRYDKMQAQAAAKHRALEGLMPFNGRGECFYCGIGSVPDSDGWHFDRDNLWNGDQRCLNDSYYDDARAALVLDAGRPMLEALRRMEEALRAELVSSPYGPLIFEGTHTPDCLTSVMEGESGCSKRCIRVRAALSEGGK